MDHRTPAEVEDSERRKAEVLRLKRRFNLTFEEIGQRLQPPVSKQRVHQIYWEAINEIVAPEVAAWRSHYREILNEALCTALEIVERDHVTVSHGKVIYDDRTGQPLLDDGPKLSALTRAQALIESMRKLDGVDAPIKAEVAGAVAFQYKFAGAEDV